MPLQISHTIKDAAAIAGSVPTAYRRINTLKEYGLATLSRGRFQISRTARQPMYVLEHLLPSLIALKGAIRFGRKYRASDISFFKGKLPKNAIVTLDHRCWDLTKYQVPNDLYVYVDDILETSRFLKKNRFSQGSRGHVVLLQKQPATKDTVEQVYLDCIAKGGRSILDAIAIGIKYGDMLSVNGKFDIGNVLKVQDDMI